MTDENKPASNDLVIERIFNAPRALVWRAWTEPEMIKRWWGPETFTAPEVRVDLRVGGKCVFCMRSPEGQDFWSMGIYLEIVPQEKIVVTDSFADENGNPVPPSHYGMPGDWSDDMRVIVTFEDYQGKTKMTLRHIGLPAGDMAGAGWNQQFDKLVELLREEQQ